MFVLESEADNLVKDHAHGHASRRRSDSVFILFLGRAVRSLGEPVCNDVLSADSDLRPQRLRDKHLAPELERRVEEASGMPDEESALHDRFFLGKPIPGDIGH